MRELRWSTVTLVAWTLFGFTLGYNVGRPADHREKPRLESTMGLTDSADRMARALERIADRLDQAAK